MPLRPTNQPRRPDGESEGKGESEGEREGAREGRREAGREAGPEARRKGGRKAKRERNEIKVRGRAPNRRCGNDGQTQVRLPRRLVPRRRRRAAPLGRASGAARRVGGLWQGHD